MELDLSLTAELTQGKKNPMMKIPVSGPPTRLHMVPVASISLSVMCSAAKDSPMLTPPKMKASHAGKMNTSNFQ